MFKKRFDYIDFQLGDLDDSINNLNEFWNKCVDEVKIHNKIVIQAINELKGNLIDKFDGLDDILSEWKKFIGSILKSLDELHKSQDCLWESIENVGEDQRGIAKEITAIRETQLSAYEDLARNSTETKKQFTKVNDKLELIDGCAEDILSTVSRIAVNFPSIGYINELKAENKELRRENEELKKANETLETANGNLCKDITSLSDSFAVVTQGVYNQQSIEFAAVKTYREGWRYICYNGRQITNFGDIEDLSIYYERNEPMRVEINFIGKS